jgi:hypothetical protein
VQCVESELIFRRNTSSGPKNKPSKTPARSRALLATYFVLVPCLSYSSALKMEVTSDSETLLYFQQTTLRCFTEDRTLHSDRCESLKSCNINAFITNNKDIEVTSGASVYK